MAKRTNAAAAPQNQPKPGDLPGAGAPVNTGAAIGAAPIPAQAPASAAETSKPAKVPEGTVLVNKEALDNLLARVARVEAVADVSRLDKFDQKSAKKQPSRFKVGTFNGKVILRWDNLRNISFKDMTTGRLVSDQAYQVTLEDESTFEVKGYMEFSNIRYGEMIVGEEVSKKTETVNDKEVTTYTLRLLDGSNRNIEIESPFVN